MPTTDQPTTSSIISPSPYFPRTQSFTMANYASIMDISFCFSDHPTYPAFSKALNDTYAEPFAVPAVASLFTDAGCTTVVPDVVPVLCAAIIDTIMISSTADQTIVALIINGMLLFVKAGTPPRKIPIWSTGTMTTTLTTYVASNQTYVLLNINPATVFVDPTTFTIMNFGGTTLTGPIRPTALRTGTGTGAGTSAAAAITPTQAATAAAQVLVAKQTATAAVFAATLPVTFNLLLLPLDVKSCHLRHLNPSYLLTASDMVPFPTAIGGACPFLSHLDPPMGTGVTRQPDSNRVIARNGHFFLGGPRQYGFESFLFQCSYLCWNIL